MKRFDGIIFDIDGILVDVSQSYREVIRKTASYFLKREATKEEVDNVKSKVGMNNDWDATYALINNKNIAYKKVKAYFQSLYLGDKKKKGLIENEKLLITKNQLLQIKNKFKKLGIATGRPKIEAEYVIKKNKLENIFECVVAMEDVKNAKPAPDQLLMATELLNIKKAIYVGDSINDVIAARSAKMPCIYVGSKNISSYYFRSVPQLVNFLL